MKCCLTLLASVVLSLVVTGCGPKSVPVTGTISYRNQPVADATVVFTPQGAGRQATGETDAQGRFTLGTDGPGDGAIPGDYAVSVTPKQPPPTEGDYSVGSDPPFPLRYSDPTGTDLKVTVKDEKNDFPLELKD